MMVGTGGLSYIIGEGYKIFLIYTSPEVQYLVVAYSASLCAIDLCPASAEDFPDDAASPESVVLLRIFTYKRWQYQPTNENLQTNFFMLTRTKYVVWNH